MSSLHFRHHRRHFQAIRQAALRAADAGLAVKRQLRLGPSTLYAGEHRLALPPSGRIWLIALGKAAPQMARAAAEILGNRLHAGLATVARHGPHGQEAADAGEPPQRIRFIPAEHPTPGEGSLSAGGAAAELLSGTHPDDLVLALISGGGSALMELPLPGVSLQDLQALNRRLLASGATIGQVNTIRRALSRIKAGGLARLAWPARVVGLILSDVVGDRLSVVASGPTVLRGASPSAALEMLQQLGLWQTVPAPIRRALERESAGGGRARRPINLLVGSNRAMLRVAAGAAERLGFRVRVLTQRMHGEARWVGTRFADRLRRAAPRTCLLMGGETTVSVSGSGRGGRNQELALAAGLALEGADGKAVMAWASDGVDGPTDAAGAITDGHLAATARALGLEPSAALQDNDAYPLLAALGALIVTGPTGTNLNDMVVGLSYAAD